MFYVIVAIGGFVLKFIDVYSLLLLWYRRVASGVTTELPKRTTDLESVILFLYDVFNKERLIVWANHLQRMDDTVNMQVR